MQTPVIQAIHATREYLNYLEQHYINVQKAFALATERWSSEDVIQDAEKYLMLENEVLMHDYSKLGYKEFVQYRQHYYPSNYEKDTIILRDIQTRYKAAVQHHKETNLHHCEAIHQAKGNKDVYYAHMIIDWMAMSFEFNDTAKEYYEKNSHALSIDVDYREYVTRLLDLLI